MFTFLLSVELVSIF
jgi:vacuolar protein sorting-associated protein 8